MPRKIRSVQDLEPVEFDDGMEDEEMEASDFEPKKKKKKAPKKKPKRTMGSYLTRKSYRKSQLDQADPSYKME